MKNTAWIAGLLVAGLPSVTILFRIIAAGSKVRESHLHANPLCNLHFLRFK